MSHATSKLGIRINNAITKGKRPNQQNSTKSLKRTRGSDARNHTKINANTQVLPASTKLSIEIKVVLAKISGA